MPNKSSVKSETSIKRLKKFVFEQKCIPWSISNRYGNWLERKVYFDSPGLYSLLKYQRLRNIVTPLTKAPGHHFFGYYEKTPWNLSGSRILAHQASFNDRPPNADDKLQIGFVTTTAKLPGDFVPVAETESWNWQQGAMLQWYPSEAENQILYNERREGQFVSIKRDLNSDTETLYERPVYAITPDGQYIFSLNFSRLFDKRPGYGYAGIPDPFTRLKHPDQDGIFRLNTGTGQSELIISLNQLAKTNPLPSMKDNYHWINHIQVSPGGSRIAFFHIWQNSESTWDVRFYCSRIDGTGLQCILDTGDVSHYDWKDDHTILVWAKHPDGATHFLMCDLDNDGIEIFGAKDLTVDGHCSFSPDGRWVLNDTYPDEYNMRTLMVIRMSDQKRIDLQRFYSPKEKWWGEIRCDLHPRWSRDGKKICIDSVHTGERQMHIVDVEGII